MLPLPLPEFHPCRLLQSARDVEHARGLSGMRSPPSVSPGVSSNRSAIARPMNLFSSCSVYVMSNATSLPSSFPVNFIVYAFFHFILINHTGTQSSSFRLPGPIPRWIAWSPAPVSSALPFFLQEACQCFRPDVSAGPRPARVCGQPFPVSLRFSVRVVKLLPFDPISIRQAPSRAVCPYGQDPPLVFRLERPSPFGFTFPLPSYPRPLQAPGVGGRNSQA